MAIHAVIRFNGQSGNITLRTSYPSSAKPSYVAESLNVIVRNVPQQLPSQMANALLVSEAAHIAHLESNDVGNHDEYPPAASEERVQEARQMAYRVAPPGAPKPTRNIYEVYTDDHDAALDTGGGEESVRLRYSDGCSDSADWDTVDWDWDRRLGDIAED